MNEFLYNPMGFISGTKSKLKIYFNHLMQNKDMREKVFASAFAIQIGDKKIKYQAMAGLCCVPGLITWAAAGTLYLAVKDISQILHYRRVNKIAVQNEVYLRINERFARGKEQGLILKNY